MGQIDSTLKSSNEDCAGRTPEGGPLGGQTPPRRGPTLAHAWVLSGPTRAPPIPPLRPYNLRIGKTLDTERKSTKSSVATVIAEARFRGQKSLFRHPSGAGNCPRKPSPSTSPPSPSPLLTPMMRRE